jgi:heme O synthase-like polyprenyltransferase
MTAKLYVVFVGVFLVEVPSWGNASLIEIIWTVIGLGAVAVAAHALPRVVGDWHIARDSNRFALRLIARGHVRREVIRLGQGAILLAIGLYACVTPSPAPGPVVVSLTGIILTAGLLAIGALVALESILDRRQRREAENLLRRHAGENEP